MKSIKRNALSKAIGIYLGSATAFTLTSWVIGTKVGVPEGLDGFTRPGILCLVWGAVCEIVVALIFIVFVFCPIAAIYEWLSGAKELVTEADKKL